MLYLFTDTGQVRRWPDTEMTIGAAADGPFMDAWESDAQCVVLAWVSDAWASANAAPDLPELVWAPYQEFGIPDRAAESHEPPAFPTWVRATGYRGTKIIVYWEGEAPGS